MLNMVHLQIAMGLATMLLPASTAFAEEEINAGINTAGAFASRSASPAEYVILLLPIIIYGIFSLYRAKVNPRIKVSDFLFILAAIVIVANILSIAIFKKRLF